MIGRLNEKATASLYCAEESRCGSAQNENDVETFALRLFARGDCASAHDGSRLHTNGQGAGDDAATGRFG